MAYSLSAKKRVRQTIKVTARNKRYFSEARTYLKKFHKAITSQRPEESLQFLRLSLQKLDRLVQKGIVHERTAARWKSRAQVRYNRFVVATQ